VSGWIKLEKDLRQDPRVLRMARELDKRYHLFSVHDELDPTNAVALPAVTLVIGGLTQLWCFADSFARDDDTLDIGPAEINQLTGIQGFAEAMPRDWLKVLDSEHVQLPGFHEHNGTEARRRALTAKRVAALRKRSKVTQEDKGVTHEALPDRDQTKTKTYTKTKGNGDREPRAPRAPTAKRLPTEFELTEARMEIARAEKADPQREFAKFRDHWCAASGANARKHDWDAAWRNWCRKAADMRANGRGPASKPEEPPWHPPPDDVDVQH
jgi:hypothetical protein